MKFKITILLLILLTNYIGSNSVFAQVTIGVLEEPKATLDIRSANPSIPTAIDGILVPLVTNFPEENPPSSPTETGNLVLLRKDAGTKEEFQSKTDGFYYWNGNEWVHLITAPSSEVMEQIYCVYGQDFKSITGSSYNNIDRQVLFNKLVYNDLNVSDDKKFTLSDNQLTIGKTGTYLVSLSITFKRTPASNASCDAQTDFTAKVLVNNNTTPIVQGITNTSSETTSGSQILVNVIVKLIKGNVLTAYVRQVSADSTSTGAPCNYPYNGLGVNSLTLYYLHK
ncbi:MAG: hypothetical protein LBQ74_07675 [Prevotella sp.]|jgi:hypothetical protein|nr:hypothetical protein [Prevotella sp.]